QVDTRGGRPLAHSAYTARVNSTRASAAAALALAAATVTLGGADAVADVGTRLPHIAQRRQDVARAGASPNAYLGLRQIWQEWDRGEPLDVEEAVRGISADTAEPAPIRAYAKLLESYARRRRGDLE